MSTKWLLGFCLMLALLVAVGWGIGAQVSAQPATAASDCCAKTAECCFEGAACCLEELPCCFEGRACCEVPQACCALGG